MDDEGRKSDTALDGNSAASAPVPEGTIERLEQELAEANDRVLRVQAELENYRKRVRREMEDERRYAIVPLVKDLLHVVDNLERAIEAAAHGGGGQELLDGVKLVASQLEGVLNQHQCVRISAVGEPFDPNQHQAIAQEPNDQFPAGTVSRAVQAGYKLFDRVIRPAQVFVSTGAPAPQENSAPQT